MRAVFVGNRNAGKSAHFRDGDLGGGFFSPLENLHSLADLQTRAAEARKDCVSLHLALMSATRRGKPTERLQLQLDKALAKLKKLEARAAA